MIIICEWFLEIEAKVVKINKSDNINSHAVKI